MHEWVRANGLNARSLGRSITLTTAVLVRSDAGTRMQARSLFVTHTLGSATAGLEGLLPGVSTGSPNRGPIISSVSAASDIIAREWFRGEFGMKLPGYEERMLGDLNDFDEVAVRRQA